MPLSKPWREKVNEPALFELGITFSLPRQGHLIARAFLGVGIGAKASIGTLQARLHLPQGVSQSLMPSSEPSYSHSERQKLHTYANSPSKS
jgi:hypothetical protein